MTIAHAKSARSNQSKHSSRALVPRTRAHAAPSSTSGDGIDQLLSGKVIGLPRKPKEARRKQKQPERLPAEIEELADVLVAGRKIDREIQFKVRFAHERVQEYCMRRFAERFMESGHRPESATYATERSVFSFIPTRRITLTPEKIEALAMMNISLDGQTELKGLRVNFDAIREHKLEYKLRDALKSMGVPQKVLVECFQPDVQLKESFFEHLSSVVDRSLAKDEDGKEKMFQALRVLGPASQIRNAEIPNLGPERSFKLIHDTEIAVTEDLDALDD